MAPWPLRLGGRRAALTIIDGAQRADGNNRHGSLVSVAAPTPVATAAATATAITVRVPIGLASGAGSWSRRPGRARPSPSARDGWRGRERESRPVAAGARGRRKAGAGLLPARMSTGVQGRGVLARAAVSAGVSGRVRRELGRGPRCRRRRPAGAVCDAGDVLEGDCAFDLLAGEDDLLVPAHKDADAAVAFGAADAAGGAAGVGGFGRHGSGQGRARSDWDSGIGSNPFAEGEMGRRSRQAARFSISGDKGHLAAERCRCRVREVSSLTVLS